MVRAPGKLIAIDGIDGSGKATQATLLHERLTKEGVACEKVDFPTRTGSFFGTLVAECLAGKRGDFAHMDPKMASIPYALDRFESAEKMKQWLAEGKMVIADRFSSSNQIHQGGKIVDSEKRDAFLKWVEEMEHEVLGIPRADAVIHLRVPVDISLALLAKIRASKNPLLKPGEKDVVEKDRMYLERSVESAERLAATQEGWHQVECLKEGAIRTPEEIHEDVYAIVSKLIA